VFVVREGVVAIVAQNGTGNPLLAFAAMEGGHHRHCHPENRNPCSNLQQEVIVVVVAKKRETPPPTPICSKGGVVVIVVIIAQK
jgi:hypothetical protein